MDLVHKMVMQLFLKCSNLCSLTWQDVEYEVEAKETYLTQIDRVSEKLWPLVWVKQVLGENCRSVPDACSAC